MQTLGALICSLVAIRFAVLTVAALHYRRMLDQRGQLQLALLENRIQTSRARRERITSTSWGWSGYRKFRVTRKVTETSDVCSFYLRPVDGTLLPSFRPGQFLTFRLYVPGQQEPVVRCYSLSDRPRGDEYRITVKRVVATAGSDAGTPGLASNFLHDAINVGDILETKPPCGKFTLDQESDRSVVLVGGGVGVTPLLSMVNALAEDGFDRETWLFHAVHDPADPLMSCHFRELEERYPNFHYVVASSADTAELVDLRGRITAEAIRDRLDGLDHDFYVCGPGSMTTDICGGLKALSVASSQIRSEAFGPSAAAPSKTPQATPEQKADSDEKPEAHTVEFVKSGKTCTWIPSSGSLLELAEQNGVSIKSSCRSGNCGSCRVRIRRGAVAQSGGNRTCAGDASLMCVGVPCSDVELNA